MRQIHPISLVDAGAKTLQEIKDVGGSRLDASARDEDGNNSGLIQAPV